MKSKYLLTLLIALSTKILVSQLNFNTVALTGVTIIDVKDQKKLINQTIIIHKGTIIQISSNESKLFPDSIVQIKLSGKFIIPGLIDSHVHLATDPSGVDNRGNTEKVLKEMLYSGVTSVRDMAGDTRSLNSLSRDAIVGDINSPNIYYSALMAGPNFFGDSRTQISTKGGEAGKMPFMKAITDSMDLKLAIAEAKGTGATGIKLYMFVSKDLAKKVVVESKEQNMMVWSHAKLVPANAIDVVNSGVTVISHADGLINLDTIPKAWRSAYKTDFSKEYWDDEFKKLELEPLFKLMKEKGTILDATMSVYKNMIKEKPKMLWIYEISKRIVAKAYLSGVKICTGTDVDQKFFVQEEIKLLVKECGFTNNDAIISGTKNCAEAIGILNKTGTIEVGKTADLVILEKNPIDDIENINKVIYVVKSGKIYKK